MSICRIWLIRVTAMHAQGFRLGEIIRNLCSLSKLSWLGLLTPLFLLAGTPTLAFPEEVSSAPKVVFAHMVNTVKAVNWAMGIGVNGLEIDLRFNSINMPSKFKHSSLFEPCDCSAGDGYLSGDNVCKHMGFFMCHASTPAADLLSHLAKVQFSNQLAVIYIDSKVDTSDAPPDISIAGTNVIAFLDTNLFAKGYKGQVIISTGDIKYIAYTKRAIEAANSSSNKSRYYFTFDGLSSTPNISPSPEVATQEFQVAIKALIDLGTANRVYSVGISKTMPGTFYNQVSLSTYNKKTGVLAATGVWTLDSKDSMNKYLSYDVDSIMTNVPGDALSVFTDLHIPLAKPGEALRASTNNDLVLKLPDGEVCESDSNCRLGHCGCSPAKDRTAKVCCSPLSSPSNLRGAP